MNFDKIEEVRIEKGLSCYELCHMADVNQGSYSKWRKKKFNPSMNNLYKICKALNIDMKELISTKTEA